MSAHTHTHRETRAARMASLFVVDRSKLQRRELTLLHRLEREYSEQLARDVLLPLVTQTSAVSLRALDWAVTNWSKQHNVVCSSSVPGQLTNVHHSYRATLGFWKRKLFDPFRRRNRVVLRLDGHEYETTLGQANFALWTYKSGVLAYVLGHVDAIEEHMNHAAQKHKLARKEAAQRGVRHKRAELTAAPGSMCVAFETPCRVDFE